MSVLIKGMTMPEHCMSCDLCNPYVDEPYCRRFLRIVPKEGRLKDCPLEEQKVGRWIHHDDGSYAGGGYEECSYCGWRCSEWVFIEDSKYCPNCGAKMEGGLE